MRCMAADVYRFAQNQAESWANLTKIPCQRIESTVFVMGDHWFFLVDSDFDGIQNNCVDVRRLASTNRPVAIGLWTAMANAAGFSPKLPDRFLQKRDSVYFLTRISEYMAAPDLSPAVYRKIYKATGEAAVAVWWNRQIPASKARLSNEIMSDQDIVSVFIPLWASAWHHRYRKESDDENGKMFHHWVKQRLAAVAQKATTKNSMFIPMEAKHLRYGELNG